MNITKVYFYSALVLTLTVLILLGTGSSLLTTALDGNNKVPLGTPITWTGMIALPLTVFLGVGALRKPATKFDGFLSVLLKVVIVLGLLWAPLSYLLAGNLSFSFTERETFQGGQAAMRWFWRLSYGIGIGSVLIILTYWVSLLFRRGKPGANHG